LQRKSPADAGLFFIAYIVMCLSLDHDWAALRVTPAFVPAAIPTFMSATIPVAMFPNNNYMPRAVDDNRRAMTVHAVADPHVNALCQCGSGHADRRSGCENCKKLPHGFFS
jgi:hypothetical protein